MTKSNTVIPAGLLHGKLALVTGAGQGIGRAIAMGLARAGAAVVVTDRHAECCAATADDIAALGGKAWAEMLDVTDADACTVLAARVAADIGAIDCLVNNAGMLIREGIDSPRALDNYRLMLDVNLVGPMNVVHAFLPALRIRRGNIINVVSGAAFVGLAGSLGYSPSKGGLKLLTQSLANELAVDGIRVNAVAPGVIETPMTEVTRASTEAMGAFMQRIPLRRVGCPQEIAGPVAFLASELASYVTGVTLPVDGGFLAV